MLDHASPSAVVGIDPSPEFVAHVKANLEDPRATFAVGSAMELDFDDGAFGAAAAGLVLNFVPDPAVAATEMRRVVRPGGTVGAYVWDYAGEMRMLRVFFDAAVELDPEAAQMDEGRRFPLCRPDRLLALFEGAGLQAVEVRSLDVDMDFQDFNDYWNPFLGGQGPAPHYAMSLDSARRGRLRDLIRSRLKPDPDGHIRMVSRSWAVKGTA
jgi:SAM-dependent methyltransferase